MLTDADKFPELPKPMVMRADLALAVLADGPSLGLYDNVLIVAGFKDGVGIFDLDLKPNAENIQLLRKAADELENYEKGTKDERQQG